MGLERVFEANHQLRSAKTQLTLKYLEMNVKSNDKFAGTFHNCSGMKDFKTCSGSLDVEVKFCQSMVTSPSSLQNRTTVSCFL